MLDFRVATFLTVCKTLNFTRAADELNLTQPAVTQHIHFLEKYYGVKLFRYDKKVLYLTDDGKILYERLNSIKKDEDEIQNELRFKKDIFSLISFGVTMTIGEYAIVEPIASFISSHPEINIHIHYGNTYDLLKMLDDGIISFALIEGYYPEEKYGHCKYMTDDFICICSSNHVFSRIKPDNLRDLINEKLILREKGSGTRNILERCLASRGMGISQFKSFIQAENMHTIVNLVENDCGIAFLYKTAANESLKKGYIRELKLSDFSMKHNFDFVWDKNSIYADITLEFAKKLMS